MSIDPTAFVPEIPGSEPVGLPADGSYLGSAEPEPHATPITPTQEFVERAHPLTPLAKGWIIFVAVLFAVGREFLPGGEVWETDEQGESVVHLLSQAWMWALLGLLGVILVAVAAGWWSWRHTLFTVSDKELRVESGKFFRTSKRVAYNQVQSIDVVQPLAARILGLAEVRVDAGSSEAVKLEFLKKEKAREMREYLLWRAGKTTLTAGAR
ncbi:MAG: PH domain-containing protein, partial [Propionibacteriaceae bacterium]|nr:PH domain-containing protein [Propionibacteriaceae bacterium]